MSSQGRKWPKRTKKVVFKKKFKTEEDEKSEVTRLIGQRATFDSSKAATFKDFILSRRTKEGLKLGNYVNPTEIQKEAIGLALRGMDILGAAKTGSGKTLAFVIPILELLYTKLWTKSDGLGALIITPTRELAYQIFETFKKIGCKHEFSAALVIGGSDFQFERKRMDQVNILICTPGRLLQHMDENSMFDCLSLQILVLDEADRCLDMGFQETMNAIIANLPEDRQTLLFSATQTKSVKDLARLSLKSPVYVSVHENSEFSTPGNLQQSYMVCPLELKLDVLWSFLKHHKRSKILVFLSGCKQVRYINLLFCRMRPGISLLALYGTLPQTKRMKVYDEFCRKQACCLFATDIASRGLDFPEIDWVIQLDCPEDASTYIHRVGRTARYNRNGEALLILIPSEEKAAVAELTASKIPIEKIDVNQKKLTSPLKKFEALLARDVELKECAQRAFKAYLRHVFFMKNKEIFDVNELDLPSFARSLGLAVAPRVRFLERSKKQGKSEGEGDTETPEIKKEESDSEEAEEQQRKSRKRKPDSTFNFDVESGDSDGVEDLFTSKKPVIFEDEDEADLEIQKSQKSKKVKTKANLAKKLMKRKIQVNQKFNFDEEGEAILDVQKQKQSDSARNYENENASGIDIEKAKEILRLEDKYDKQIFRERVRAKHREERLKAKSLRKNSRRGKSNEDEDGYDSETNDALVKIGRSADDGESSEDSDNYEPNLDWLPDPDKVYGERNSEEEEPEKSDIETPSSSTKVKKSKKRKIGEEDKVVKLLSKKKVNKFDRAAKRDKLDGGMMEELALKLLQS